MPQYTTHSTPNPNSIKITTSDDVPFIDEGMVSFNSAHEAADHPLGSHLFSIQGVDNVFIMPDFVTVTKHPAADWNGMIPQIKQILDGYFEER